MKSIVIVSKGFAGDSIGCKLNALSLHYFVEFVSSGRPLAAPLGIIESGFVDPRPLKTQAPTATCNRNVVTERRYPPYLTYRIILV